MSLLLQVPMTSSAGGTVLETYSVGDVLIWKANRGKLPELVALIESYQADVNYRNQHGCSALHAAAASGQLEVVHWLLENCNVDRSATDHDEQTALHYAAFFGHLEVVQYLVEHDVPLDIPDKFGRLAHCSAAINGHLDVVKYLIEECPRPIDINAIDEYGGTCLHWAASKGRKEVIQYLCMKGIDVHVTSYDNKTAYQIAKDKHKTKCVQFLKSWYETSQKFVHAAEEGDNDEIARIISEVNGTFPLRYMRDKNGKNAMHWAAEFGHLSTLKLLCDHFAVWTDGDKFGRNALHSSALGGHRECALLLLRRAPDASEFLSLTMTNKSPSRCAFEAGHSALANALQAWEDGNDDYSIQDDSSAPSSGEHEAYRLATDDEESTIAGGVSSGRNMDTVRNWLKMFKMEEYTSNFEKDGFDTLHGVATIDENDLIDMDVKKGHRRVVLSHIEELRNQLALLDENMQKTGQELHASPTLSMLPQLPKQPSLSNLSSDGSTAPRTERRGSMTGSVTGPLLDC